MTGADAQLVTSLHFTLDMPQPGTLQEVEAPRQASPQSILGVLHIPGSGMSKRKCNTCVQTDDSLCAAIACLNRFKMSRQNCHQRQPACSGYLQNASPTLKYFKEAGWGGDDTAGNQWVLPHLPRITVPVLHRALGGVPPPTMASMGYPTTVNVCRIWRRSRVPAGESSGTFCQSIGAGC